MCPSEHRSDKRTNRSGFTLIELLVVIGIIMVLAGLLFPAFRGAREMAKKAKAKADVKQLEIALKSVLSDYGTWQKANVPGSDGDGYCAATDVGSGIVNYLKGGNGFGTIYLEIDGKSLGQSGEFIDPWERIYRAAWGKNSIKDPSGAGILYRNAATWSTGGSDGKWVKSWE